MCDMLFDEYDLDDDHDNPTMDRLLIRESTDLDVLNRFLTTAHDDTMNVSTCEDCKVTDDGWSDEQIRFRDVGGRHRLCLCYHCYTDRCDAL